MQVECGLLVVRNEADDSQTGKRTRETQTLSRPRSNKHTRTATIPRLLLLLPKLKDKPLPCGWLKQECLFTLEPLLCCCVEPPCRCLLGRGETTTSDQTYCGLVISESLQTDSPFSKRSAIQEQIGFLLKPAVVDETMRGFVWI